MKTNELPNIELVDMPECGGYGPDYLQQYYSEQEIEGEYWRAIPDQFLLPQAKGSLFISNLGRVYVSGFTYMTETGKIKNYPARFNKIYYRPITNRYATGVYHLFNNRRTFDIHRLLAMAFMSHIPDGHSLIVDHKDNDPTNNRLENLQVITNRENLSKDRINCKSPYTGVFINTRTKNIFSKIYYTDIGQINIGTYPTQRQARTAYLAALEYGEYHPGKQFNRRYIKFIKDIVNQIVATFDNFESQATDDYLLYPAKKEFDFSRITPDLSILTTPIARKRKKENHLTLDELARNLFGNNKK